MGFRHGGLSYAMTREYHSWYSAIKRCHNNKAINYQDYGGSGVSVCDRWRDPISGFLNFLEDMGPRPLGRTLDRYPNARGNYEPGNCRWATPSEQQNNLKSNRRVTMRGKTMGVAQWARELGMSKEALKYRLDSGWTEEQILNLKLNYGNGWSRNKEEQWKTSRTIQAG